MGHRVYIYARKCEIFSTLIQLNIFSAAVVNSFEDFASAFANLYGLFDNNPIGYGIIGNDDIIYSSSHIVDSSCITSIFGNMRAIIFSQSEITTNKNVIRIPVSNYKDKVFPMKLPVNLLIAIKIFHFKAIGHAGHETHLVTGNRFFSPNIKF